MSERSRVLVSMRVEASPARAFSAFTDEIGQWWRPNGLFQFSDGRSGTLAFEPGVDGRRLRETYPEGDSFVIGDVQVWEPPHLLVVSWRTQRFPPDRVTELHVRFDPVGEQTRVTVEHYGWDALPAEHAARHGFPLPVFQQHWAEWWRDMLDDLASSIITTSDR
jgi:uncharacterized protein YndB with AHSA1/START domain